MSGPFQGTCGVILAGGLSRRMDGVEKNLIKLGGEELISLVATRFRKQVGQVLINANGDPARFAFLDLPVKPDTIPGHVGPLAGVLAAMRWAEGSTEGITRILTVATDTPFFPASYASQMHAALVDTTADIAMATSLGRRHPVFGLWPVHLADELEQFLVGEKGRKVMMFVERYANCQVLFNQFPTLDGVVDPFFNVNTPRDLVEAELIASRMVPDG